MNVLNGTISIQMVNFVKILKKNFKKFAPNPTTSIYAKNAKYLPNKLVFTVIDKCVLFLRISMAFDS